MTHLLYWLVYHCDLGPLGPRVMDLAVKSWLKREARAAEASPLGAIFRPSARHALNFGK